MTISRQAEHERSPVSIHTVVAETLRLMRATLPTTIDIVVEKPGFDDVVMADVIQMQQVILNLCANAGYAMTARGGILKISIQRIDMDDNLASTYGLDQGGCYLELVVSDTGEGIPPDIIERIFDPFFTTKTRGQGTGLGLSVTMGIVRDHGGAITVDSKPGEGAAFHIFLPLSMEKAVVPADISEPVPGGTERILIVDDESAIAEMNRHILEILGYRVMVTSDSLYALELFRSSPGDFDAMVTDQTMPGLTGFELSRQVLSIRPDFPIVLCTGYSETVDAERATSAGIREFLYKPIPSRDLARALRRALDEKGKTVV